MFCSVSFPALYFENEWENPKWMNTKIVVSKVLYNWWALGVNIANHGRYLKNVGGMHGIHYLKKLYELLIPQPHIWSALQGNHLWNNKYHSRLEIEWQWHA
jgi:hypothetical protein